MNELQIFSNPEFGQVRTVEIEGEPWLVGKDVAQALGYTNPQKAIRDHVDDDDRGVNEMVTPGGKQMLTWYNRLHTDSAEYKMWGNGIALPPALYIMQGIRDALESGGRDG